MNQQAPAPPIWWLIWATITAAFFLAVGIFETAATPASTLSWLALMALPPFLASAVIRLRPAPPVSRARPKKFIFFLLGLALAQSGGFFALILSSPWKTPLAAADLVLIVVYIPALIIRRP